MKTSSLQFNLPKELIAEHPITPRDAARLMVVSKKTGQITESLFSDIGRFLKTGDVLVFNKSKVFQARVVAQRENGKEIEILFLNNIGKNVWEILVGGKINDGETISLGHGFTGTIQKGETLIFKGSLNKKEVLKFLQQFGQVPLPPYIKRKPEGRDKVDYQNVFAKVTGSAAAPTAGMHFTRELIKSLSASGIQIEYVTLHVGLGTFTPIRTENLEDHKIHEEYYGLTADVKKRIIKAKNEGRRIIACGTTTLRVLESMDLSSGAEKRTTRIFIYPGYKFKIVDGLITNFHTPSSSLLALVWAFGGKILMQKAYRTAIKEKYRFFSYGDGMLII